MLVVAAGLFVRTFASLTSRTLGFEADHVLVVVMDAQRTTTDPAERLPLYERARDAVRALPNVADAAVSYVTPFSNAFTPRIEVSGLPPRDTYWRCLGESDLPTMVQHVWDAARRRTRLHGSRPPRRASGGGGQ